MMSKFKVEKLSFRGQKVTPKKH